MSNRTLVELNHDICPSPSMSDASLVIWARCMATYIGSGDKSDLPAGVTFKSIRHHSEPDPMKGHGDPS